MNLRFLTKEKQIKTTLGKYFEVSVSLKFTARRLNVQLGIMFFVRRLYGRINNMKDETVTSIGFTNATPQRKVLFIDRLTG